MLNLESFCRNLSDLVGQPVVDSDPQTLVGVLQKFRPDASELESLFDFSDAGRAVFSRLTNIFEVAGNARRPDGMLDAFFIVRSPKPYDGSHIQESGERFFVSLANLAFEQGKDQLANCLSPLPALRLVEGDPPKHPKSEAEQSNLMQAVTKAGKTVTKELIESSEAARFLQTAFYFVACDAFLRDYLLWPLVAEKSAVKDPFDDYFQLWRHGVKFRIFGESQIDFYLPRHF